MSPGTWALLAWASAAAANQPAAPRAVHYEIAAEIAPARQHVDARVLLTVEAAGETSSLRVFLHEELSLRSARLGEHALPVTVLPRSAQALPNSPTAVPMDIGLPLRLAKGERATVELVYDGVVTRTINGVNLVSEPLTELALYSAWYPVLAGAREFTCDLRATLPAGYVVLSDGEERERHEDEAHTRARFTRSLPGSDVVLIAAKGLKRVSRELPGLTVDVYHRDLPESEAARLGEAAGEAYAFLQRALGPPTRGGRMVLVASPRDGWGYSRPPLSVVSETYARQQLARAGGRFELLHGSLHEVGHSWWRLADTTTSDDWINESLAEFVALVACEQLFGEAPVAALRRQYEADVRELKGARSISETLRADPGAYVLFYEKGALLWETLRSVLGSERLFAILRRLHATERGGAKLTSAELLTTMECEAGEPAASLLREGLTSTALPSVTVEWTAVGHSVNGSVSISGARLDGLPLELAFEGANGERSEHSVIVSAGRTPFSLSLAYAASALVVDARTRLVKRELNVQRR